MKIGIDLGGSHIAIGVIDNDNCIIEKKETRILKEHRENIKNIIEDYIINNVNKLQEKYDITKIGIAIPGTVDDKKIIKSVNLGVENYNIVDAINKKINLPIKIKNDAKCAALAESRLGAIKEFKRSIFLTLGTGIGGAVIINGELLNTGEFPGCEFGHMVIEKNGLQCKCGKKGCFEKYASMKALKTNLREELNLDETTRGEELLEIIRKEKNAKIDKVVDEFIENLSIGISNLVNIFEPEVIGIGGSFVYFSDVLLDKLKQNIQTKKYLFNSRQELEIRPAILANDAGIIGSVI